MTDTNKVYLVLNSDGCVFGVFSTKAQANHVCGRLNVDYPNESWVEEKEMNTIKSWIVHSNLEELGIKVIPSE